MNTEKITKLPNEGDSISVTLSPNANGARSLKIANWKNVRYYITYYYNTAYNKKQRDAGWIACDGSDWSDLFLGDEEVAQMIRSLYPLIGGAIAE